MDEHDRAPESLRAGHQEGRHAEGVAGYAFVALTVGIGVISLLTGDLAVPAWLWAGLLVVWIAVVNWSVSERLSRTGQILLYGCAVLVSWVLLVTASPGGGVVGTVLIAVAAIGSFLIPMRWVLVVVLLNCLVSFGHVWLHGAGLATALVGTAYFLIIQVAVAFSAYAMSQEAQLRAQVEQKNLELEATGVLLADSAATTERLRISRELHDSLGHQLTVLNLELEAAKHREGPAGRAHVQRAGDVAKDLLTDVRTTVGALRESSPADLQQHQERLARAVPSLEIHVEVDAEVEADEEISAAVVRAAQEIITNALKHSEAAELALTLTLEDGMLTLTGTNDGTTPRAITPGHGLTGLTERLELLGGRLLIRTTPQFTVQARLPASHTPQRQT